jgi:4-amino-4-deoxy-L-arabinose transferase-like glycosyltransferase
MFNRYKQHIPLAYFILLAIIVFINNGNVSLWDQDEAAYAGFARGMIRSGNWLIPDFIWSEIHRKTPLHFWNISISYLVFGINEFSVRFPSALFLLLTYVVMYFAGKPLFGKRAAFISVVVLSTSLFVPSLAKISVTDATLLFFSTVCAFALLNIIQQRSVKWNIAFWISFSLALLTKGPPIVLFTGVFAVLLFVFHPNRKNLFSMHPWFFLPLACLPLFIWGYMVNQKDGGVFITWLIDWYILKRVNSSVLGQTGPPGTHLISMLVFFIPYFMFLPKALWTAITDTFRKEKGISFLLSTWFISGWFLYEWSPSKLPAYVIAAHVPLAILIGREILKFIESDRRPAMGLVITHYFFILLIYAALMVAPFMIDVPTDLKITFMIASILLTTLAVITLLNMRSPGFFKFMLGTNIFFQFLVWAILLPQADELKDGSKKIAHYAELNARPECTVLIANTQGHPPSLPFYLGNTFQEVKEETSIETLESQYQSTHPVLLVLNNEQLKELQIKIPDLNYSEIRSMLTDRDEKAHYYIAINKSGTK